MALPFFGKKPVPAGSPSPRPRTSSGAAASPVSSSAKSSRSSTPRNETSSLDFTIAGGDLSRVLAQCADKVHVEEGVDEMTASVEEAAIVYANGCYDEARGVLEQALATTTTADARYALWGMLLDLVFARLQRAVTYAD